VIGWFEQSAYWMVDLEVLNVAGHKLEVSVAGLIGAILVVVAGKWLARRKQAKTEDRAAGA
jgi:phosphate starvation-inducible membrane PsiE